MCNFVCCWCDPGGGQVSQVHYLMCSVQPGITELRVEVVRVTFLQDSGLSIETRCYRCLGWYCVQAGQVLRVLGCSVAPSVTEAAGVFSRVAQKGGLSPPHAC